MDNLFEGLKAGDLEELILPRVSIDEYESKLDDDSVVVAFYLLDRDPAQDLNRFIQKGAEDLLDTDVSPAPTEDGHYMVFVEFLRDENLADKILGTLDSIGGLTALDRWTAEIYGSEEPVELTRENINTLVRLVPEVEETGTMEEDLVEFFRASDLDDLSIKGHSVVMEARGVRLQLSLVDLGCEDVVVENNAVMGSATRLDEAALGVSRKVQRMLGDLWLAEQRQDYLVVRHALKGDVALFRL